MGTNPSWCFNLTNRGERPSHLEWGICDTTEEQMNKESSILIGRVFSSVCSPSDGNWLFLVHLFFCCIAISDERHRAFCITATSSTQQDLSSLLPSVEVF